MTPSLLTRMSLFLTIKKLGFQIDPLPPLSPMSLYILFFLDGFPNMYK